MHHAPLTAAEMGNLWNFYMANTMSRCMLSHFLANVEDPEIRSLLTESDKLSRHIIDRVTALLGEEGVPLPEGFRAEDVQAEAPRLFSDTFYLQYLDMMYKLGGIYYAITLSNISRMELRRWITKLSAAALELSNTITELMLNKGLYIRPPVIPPTEQGYVHRERFLAGFFGDKRPLSGVEISQVFANLQFNSIKTALVTGFSQVARTDEVRDYFLRCKMINIKQTTILSKLLVQDDLPATLPSQFQITKSTVPPFSDKLMLFHVSNLSSAKVRNWGDSLAVSPRHDLGADYERNLMETMKFADDGAKLLIERGWMEQPPQAPEREKLRAGE
ncbi:DUF3231 family protein [Paenibacillus caseinilyticus]|uniref:Uncharacterized protein n=1 Tax=Paenibacillus mucilaginosus K02 TaxID=997761 RepID=I0BEI5_9BACL|nr:DUF3231 family protein [Paenibacillus mucilaginosus]AFH60782.1 hypothetical protein B2K_08640 [Paenibacillus mucilaginosus K02]